MYKWVGEINALMQKLTNEKNDIETRNGMVKETIAILDNYHVIAQVDCSSRINTAEVVNYGSFRMLVSTDEVDYIFKYVRKGE